MRVLVLLNAAAGTLATGATRRDEPRFIRARFAAADVDADVRGVRGTDLACVARAARDAGAFDVIVAGGGDGTLNAVAGALVGGSVPLGILPLGTFNHLARELRVPLDLGAAIRAIVDGQTVDFNVGRVNDRHFCSFAAIGIYSEMIRHRDAQRRSRGRRKMWAGAIAGWKMLFRWPLKRVRLHVDSAEPIERLTPVVYVSLSAIQIEQMGIRGAPADVRAKLNVFIATQKQRLGLLKLIARAAAGHVRMLKDVDLYRANRCELTVHRHRHVHVGYDGEIETMTLPLRFELIRAGLKIRVPRDPVV